MVASELPVLLDSVPRMKPDGRWEESSVIQTYKHQRSTLAMAQKMDPMNPEGYFNFFGSVTVRNNAEILMAVAEIFKEEVEPIKDEPNLQVYIVYNPLTRNALRQMKKRGGNALGLKEGDGPFIGTLNSAYFVAFLTSLVVNINMHWSDENSEARMRRFVRRLIMRFRESARKMGLLYPYIFQNHAFEEQDVFAGSGESKLARLKAIRKAVDPDGVFQKLQPGFFKLEPGLVEIIPERSEL
jgi:FAD/FMN-containing dehydrogenase